MRHESMAARRLIAQNRAQKARAATTTLQTRQEPDGSWSAAMLVTGLADERMADAAVAHMQRLFCGDEIKGEQ
ncbi:hypothetical protein [Aquabacterium sp. OR-4]|uniref:hypothetical protein n=1 Tax=Aquabacterium sp. OR-4 TaxID=2978127 RepID=UPI0021B169EF|nr:hypothetical protein [Aquabacterium sp. OR-4]MDT7835011.1 hypothetical protein [Aquabacterium sp. OR-4]